MSTTRITVTLPVDLYQDLKSLLKPREISAFVTESVKAKLFELKAYKNKSIVDEILTLRERSPKYSTQEILKMIDEGR